MICLLLSFDIWVCMVMLFLFVNLFTSFCFCCYCIGCFCLWLCFVGCLLLVELLAIAFILCWVVGCDLFGFLLFAFRSVGFCCCCLFIYLIGVTLGFTYCGFCVGLHCSCGLLWCLFGCFYVFGWVWYVRFERWLWCFGFG